MKLMVLGDCHGEGKWVRNKINWAAKHDIKKIFQVGDMGFWTHEEAGVRYLDFVNEALRETGIKLYFVAGNHDQWDHLDWHEKNSAKDWNNHTYIRSHILYTGRSNRWVWGGKTFQTVGGAVSVDKDWRTVGKNLWLDEEIPLSVVTEMEKNSPPSDYLFTHDAPSCVPMGNLKPDMDSVRHRGYMDRIGRVVQPSIWFHGHYHKWMEYSFMHQQGYASVYGLDRDFQFYSHVILDTENDTVETATGKIVEHLPFEDISNTM